MAQERRRADAAESRVGEVLEQRAKARRSQERQAAEFASLQAALRAEISAAKVWALHFAATFKFFHQQFGEVCTYPGSKEL